MSVVVTLIDMSDGFAHIVELFIEPFVNPVRRTYWAGLVVTVGIAVCYLWVVKPRSWNRNNLWSALKHPSTSLDVQIFFGRQLLTALIGTPVVVSGLWLTTRGVMWLDKLVGAPQPVEISPAAVTALYSLTLFVVWDFSRFVLHYLMHKVPFLWSFHQVHHSAEVISPLTHHRIHPVESWLYSLRGVISTSLVAGGFYWFFRGNIGQWLLFGVPALGFLCNATMGNIRHSHIWLRYPAFLERWFISPAQHQIHHSIDPQHHGKNLGTWLAIWDRMAKTLVLADQRPTSYGIAPHERNHQHNLLSAWFGPFKQIFLQVKKLAPIALSLLCFSYAHADEGDNKQQEQQKKEEKKQKKQKNKKKAKKDENFRFGKEIFVSSDDQSLLVAGSAQKVKQRQLELYSQDNMEQILSIVPGISTRNEDGFGLRPNIGIRGANSDRSAKIALMEDGVLLAPAPYAAPAAYYFPMTARVIGVEVFKGPTATRYGPHTVGGAINLLTRNVPKKSGSYFDLSAGLRNSYRAHGWGALRRAKSGVLFEGVHLRSDGFKELDTGGETGFDRSEMMLKANYMPQKNHQFALKFGYTNETSNETYVGLTETDAADNPYRRYAASEKGLMRWNRTQANLEWNYQSGPNFKARTVLYHHWLDRAWTKLNGFASGPSLHQLIVQNPQAGQGQLFMAILRGEEDSQDDAQQLQIGTNDRQFHSFGLQTRMKHEKYWSRVSSELEFGARIHGDDVRRVHTEDPHNMQGGKVVSAGEEIETLLDSHATAQAFAAHVHEDLRIDRFHFFPSARLEVVRTFRDDEGQAEEAEAITRSTWLPGAAVLFEIDDWSNLFAGVHRGFSPVAPGQPEEVQPELSWNYEVGGRLNDGTYQLEAVGFFNDYQNLIGQCTMSSGCVGTDLDQQFNGGEVWVYGFEGVAGVRFSLPAALRLPVQTSYSLTDSEFQTDFRSSFPQFGDVRYQDSLPYVAKHRASLQVGLEKSKFALSSKLSYRSEMLDQAGVFGEDELEIPSLLTLDAAAYLRFAKYWKLRFTGQNLTNVQQVSSWRPYGARPVAPMQLMLGLSHKR